MASKKDKRVAAKASVKSKPKLVARAPTGARRSRRLDNREPSISPIASPERLTRRTRNAPAREGVTRLPKGVRPLREARRRPTSPPPAPAPAPALVRKAGTPEIPESFSLSSGSPHPAAKGNPVAPRPRTDSGGDLPNYSDYEDEGDQQKQDYTAWQRAWYKPVPVEESPTIPETPSESRQVSEELGGPQPGLSSEVRAAVSPELDTSPPSNLSLHRRRSQASTPCPSPRLNRIRLGRVSSRGNSASSRKTQSSRPAETVQRSANATLPQQNPNADVPPSTLSISLPSRTDELDARSMREAIYGLAEEVPRNTGRIWGPIYTQLRQLITALENIQGGRLPEHNLPYGNGMLKRR